MHSYSFKKTVIFILLCLSGIAINTNANAVEDFNQPQIRHIVDQVIQPLMQKYQIPGMAVGVTIGGKNYFYNYGVASKETRQPITNQTLFEIGSVTKTFTGTLASYAEETHHLSLLNYPSQYLPELRGSNFDKISLLNLATHTSGLPLFVPDNIQSIQQFMDYLEHWKPLYTVGTHRIYSNNGIDLLGMSAAESLHGSYNDLLKKIILSPLGLSHTYIDVPESEMTNYAQGYTANNAPIRLSPAILLPEAYALKSCAADLIKYIEANMQEIKITESLQHAILNTHTAYFKSNYLTQDLVWEQYPYPTTLKQVLKGNGIIFMHVPVIEIIPPAQPQADVLINKTGSTNGFSTYVAFIPAKKVGIVILANKSYPLDQRVTAGYKILLRLTDKH